jgi:uncharacterized protein (DUF305 family)
MVSAHIRSALVMLAAAASLAACASAAGGPAPGSPQPDAAAESDRAAIAQARADSARHPYTEADISFMMGMIHHHAQAIIMAEMAPTHGASPSVQTLAARIMSGQREEIARMQQWLADRLQPVPQVSASGTVTMPPGDHGAHDMHGGGHDMLMPGMLTAEQLRELDVARGQEFDRLFLTFMIQHHRGAVAMVNELFDTYGAAQDETAFRLATDVNVDQITEIERMQEMLVDVILLDGSTR